MSLRIQEGKIFDQHNGFTDPIVCPNVECACPKSAAPNLDLSSTKNPRCFSETIDVSPNTRAQHFQGSQRWMGSRCDTSTHLWPEIFPQQVSISHKAHPTSWNCVVCIFDRTTRTRQRSRRKQLTQCSSVIPLSPRNCGSASSSEGGWSPPDGFTIPGTSPPEATSECRETPLN